MPSYFFPQLADDTVRRAFDTSISHACTAITTMLAYLGEFDHRKLYVRAAYGSMYQYCVHDKHMSEDTALKRIRVARAARQFPAIFPALADGCVGLSAVLLLVPHLAADTAVELLAAAAHKTNAEIEQLLAQRFPKPDVPTLVQPVPVQEMCGELAVRPVVPSDAPDLPFQVGPVSGPAALRARLAPLSPGRFALQLTVDQATHDKLRYAQALLGHALPSGEVEKVIDRALDALIDKLEKQKFAKSDRSRPQRGAAKGRHIPAAVRKAVWERDGGKCTFVSETGKRCESRTRLEFDHVEMVTRGGEATVGGIRLLCRAHNQHAADVALGSEFMQGKRQQPRERAAKARVEADAKARVEGDAKAKAGEQERAEAAAEAASQEELIPWLRALGCNKEAARTAAARCAGMVGAPLERRVFVACQGLGPRGSRRALPVASSPA
jgi:5-methylcytosine-specific restriction endonuclease McrA